MMNRPPRADTWTPPRRSDEADSDRDADGGRAMADTERREGQPVADEQTTRTLADHGARIATLEKTLAAIFAKLDAMQESLTTLVAEHRVTHTPENCHRAGEHERRILLLEQAQRADERDHATREEVAELRRTVNEHERALTTTSGAGRGLYIALGVAGTALGIIAGLIALLK